MSIYKIIGTVTVLFILIMPTAALALSDQDAKTTGFRVDQLDDQFKGISQEGQLITTIINIINSLLVLAAIAAIVFIILSGVRYVSSQGDEDAVEQAKNGLIYGIVGVIIILLSAVIVNFFISQVATGPGNFGTGPPLGGLGGGGAN